MLVILTIFGVLALASGAPVQPPVLVVSCAANPVVVAPGGQVQIRATGFSAQNRHMSYSFKSTSGKLITTGSTAILRTAPDSTATITVTCNAVDDRGVEASHTAMVTIRQP